MSIKEAVAQIKAEDEMHRQARIALSEELRELQKQCTHEFVKQQPPFDIIEKCSICGKIRMVEK